MSEAAGYLGGALALGSALTAASQVWADRWPGVEAGMLVLAGLVLWAGGRWVNSAEPDSSASRLAGVLWLLSVPAMGAAAWAAVAAWPEVSEALAWLAAGSVEVVWGLVLWRARPGVLQQLATFQGLLTALLAGLHVLAGASVPWEWAGLLLWTTGCAWAVLAWGGWVRPRCAGLVLGGLTALGGAQWMSVFRKGPGLTLAAMTVMLLLVAAVPLAQPALLGLATAGAVVFLPQILYQLFLDALTGPALAVVTGVVLLAGALATMETARKAISDGPEAPRRPIALAAAVAVAVAAAIGGLLVLGALRPPAFPALAEAPDSRVPGTVAFWNVHGSNCLSVVDAGGGKARRLGCGDVYTGDDLDWTPDGDLVFLRWVGGGRERLTIDGRTGAVRERHVLDASFDAYALQNSYTAPDGTRAATTDSYEGTVVLRVYPPEESARTLLEVSGPHNYWFESFIWSTDGAWLLVTDSAKRLLVVDADTGATRLLATDATSPAWTSAHKCDQRQPSQCPPSG